MHLFVLYAKTQQDRKLLLACVAAAFWDVKPVLTGGFKRVTPALNVVLTKTKLFIIH